ncbi:hypothetical protein LAZ67_6001392 [Cordylochernes scorpioides]|uniref:Alpha-latrotoxin n=1 Tax=Cordylochernes scorpioides TaxID=51811 RepID=A0ABY6KJT8_9ARAC|nr:hypothetical protein LAZ67_6001392 [Cordylochernes scorpioides]
MLFYILRSLEPISYGRTRNMRWVENSPTRKLNDALKAKAGEDTQLEMTLTLSKYPEARCRKSPISCFLLLKLFSIFYDKYLFIFKDDFAFISVSLRNAIQNQDIARVKDILKNKRIDINQGIHKEGSPLLMAVKHEQFEIVKMLIQANADANGDTSFGPTPLFIAAEIGNMAILECLIEAGANINAQDTLYRTPLLNAILNGHLEVVKKLVAAGAKIERENNQECIPIIMAFDFHQINIALFLIHQGADVNAKDNSSSILICAGQGDLNMVEILIKAKANVNDKDCDGNTPLHIASLKNHVKMVNYLLKNGANVNAKNKYGITPLMIYVTKNNMEMVKTLINAKAEINEVDEQGFTALYRAANIKNEIMFKYLIERGAKDMDDEILNLFVVRDNLEMVKFLINSRTEGRNWKDSTFLSKAVINNNFDLVKLLLEKSIYANSMDKWGMTPLIRGAEMGNLEIVRVLVEAKANINLKTNCGRTALSEAILNGHEFVFMYLLENGADVNVKFSNGITPLIYHVEKNSLEITEIIISCGADVNQKDKDGNSPLNVAVHKGCLKMIRILLEAGADTSAKDQFGFTPLISAVKRNYYWIVQCLIGAGVDINEEDNENQTALSTAFDKFNIDLALYLLEKGANVNVVNKYLETPLLISARKGNLKMVKYLVKAKACINVANHIGKTALSEAIENDHLNVAEFLISEGAEVNTQTESGNTPLIIAATKGNLRIVECLVNAKANLEMSNKDGKTALNLAVYHLDIAKFLIAKGANINTQSKWGSTPLINSVYRDMETVRCLVEARAKLDTADIEGYTALNTAVELGYLDIVKYLVEQGAEVNIKNKKEKFAVHHLVEEEAVEVNTKKENGETPLIVALRNAFHNCKNVINKSLSNVDIEGYHPEVTHQIIMNPYQEIIKCLIKNEACLEEDRKIDVFEKALWMKDIATLLLQYGCLVDADIEITQSILSSLIECKNYLLNVFIPYVFLTIPSLTKPENLKTFPEWSNLWDQCKSEVVKMKGVYIGDSSVTLYKFLTEYNGDKILGYMSNEDFTCQETRQHYMEDESRFCLSSDSRRVRMWRRRGERSNPAAIVERPTVRQRGIMVWGAIAYDSRSPLLRIQGTMTAQRYVDDVLRPVTLPYLQEVPNALYQQDNARPHTACISQQALQDVQMLPWPPYSPDLSPIEHVWDIIGRRLHALPQPRSEDELWQMVKREWRAIPQEAIRTLNDSLPRRVAACIAVRGGPTCY